MLLDRRLSVALATSGIFIAGMAAYSAAKTPAYVASASVAVRQPTERSQAGSDAEATASKALTEVEVIQGDRVLDLAASKLDITGSDELSESLEAKVVKGTDVLEIKARRADAQEAADWANAVAEAYVEHRRESMVENAKATGAVLSSGLEADTEQLEQVQGQIKKNPPNVEALRAEEGKLAARVNFLQTQILGLLDSEALRRGGATIIDDADVPSSPSEPDWLRDLALAGAAGIAAGWLISLAAWPPQIRKLKHGRLGEHSDDITGLIQAHQQPILSKLEDLTERVSQLSLQEPALKAALEDTKTATLRELREDRLQMAERMAELNREMLRRLGRVATKVGDEMLQLRQEIVGKAAFLEQYAYATLRDQEAGNSRAPQVTPPQHEGYGASSNAIGFRAEPSATELSAGLEGLLARLNFQLDSQQHGAATALEQVKRGIIDEVREDRAHMAEKVAQNNHELLQRFSRFAHTLGQGLEDLRDESLGKVGAIQEEMAVMHDSIESKLEVEGKAFSGQIGSVLNQLAVQAQAIETRISQAVGQLNSSLVQKADLDRAELVRRVASLDVEVAQRLGQVSIGLSDALMGLRNEVSDKLKVTERAIAGMLESLEAGRQVESSEISRRLRGVSAELSSHLEQLESRLLSSGEAMKRKLQQGSRAELNQLADGLSEIDQDAADRVSKLSASIKRSLSDLKSRVSEELSNQQLDLSSRLESLEAKVAQSTSAPKGRKAPVLPIVSNPSRTKKSKAVAGSRPASGKNFGTNGTTKKGVPKKGLPKKGIPAAKSKR